jgi:molybdopterin-binding protein
MRMPTVPPHQEATSARNVFPAMITRIVPLGLYYKINLDCGFPLVTYVTGHSLDNLSLREGQVVSASILAREAFLSGLESLSLKYRIKLPKGATQGVIETGREFIRKHGKGKLKEVAKLHFATTQQVLG